MEPTDGHTVRQFDAALGSLRLALLEMGGLVLRQVEAAVAALLEGDDAAARAVIARDVEVDRYDARVTDETVRLLAQRSPVAGDLRVVMAVGRAVRDLERIGDAAKKIAIYAIEIHSAGPDAPLAQFYRDVRQMSRLALALLRDALRAFDDLDAGAAAAMRRRDDSIDEEFRGALRHLVTIVMEDQRHLAHTINTVFVIKALERIGDHAVNLADGVLYLAGTPARASG
jgi:phosphate transport system protein